MENEKIKKQIGKAIHDQDVYADSYLIGSRARGDHGLKSDWDILILVDDEKITNEIEDKFRDVLYDIELELGQIISTFIYSKHYWKNTLVYTPLHKNVNQEGVKL